MSISSARTDGFAPPKAMSRATRPASVVCLIFMACSSDMARIAPLVVGSHRRFQRRRVGRVVAALYSLYQVRPAAAKAGLVEIALDGEGHRLDTGCAALGNGVAGARDLDLGG